MMNTLFLTLFATMCCQLFASIKINDNPLLVIQDARGGLKYPEGVSFSPDGNLLAVASFNNHSICFFEKRAGGLYSTTPSAILGGPKSLLSCPHDLSFSPDGLYLAVANRSDAQPSLRSITIYKKNKKNNFYQNIPIAIIPYPELSFPGCVKYAPTGGYLAVGNSWETHDILLFHYEGEAYSSKPYQRIQSEKLYLPDGIAFSADGELLAIASHRTNSILIHQRILDSDYYTAEPVEILQGNGTHICDPHSVSFDPSGKYLMVANAGPGENLLIFEKTTETFPRYSPIPIIIKSIYNKDNDELHKRIPEQGGVKGVAFLYDSSLIAICASDVAYDDRAVHIFQVTEE